MTIHRFSTISLVLALFLVAGCAPTASELEESMEEEVMEEQMMEQKETTPAPSVMEKAPAPAVDTSCAAQSCGEEGTDVTCLPANGCICSTQGCIDCRKKNETCEVSADCCGGQGLECRSVRLTSGSTEMRCMVLTENICNVSCSADGVWEKPRGCVPGVVRDDIEDCDTFVGECIPPIPGERPRKCISS